MGSDRQSDSSIIGNIYMTCVGFLFFQINGGNIEMHTVYNYQVVLNFMQDCRTIEPSNYREVGLSIRPTDYASIREKNQRYVISYILRKSGLIFVQSWIPFSKVIYAKFGWIGFGEDFWMLYIFVSQGWRNAFQEVSTENLAQRIVGWRKTNGRY